MIFRYMKDEFDSTKVLTASLELAFKMTKVHKDYAKLQISNTAGQEKFKAISTQYFTYAEGIILVYDITKANIQELAELNIF